MSNKLKELKEAGDLTLEQAEKDLERVKNGFHPIQQVYLKGFVQGVKRMNMLIERALEK